VFVCVCVPVKKTGGGFMMPVRLSSELQSLLSTPGESLPRESFFFFLGYSVRVMKTFHTSLSTPCGTLPQHFAHYTLLFFGRAVAEARRSCCTSSGQVQIRVEQIWVPYGGSPQLFFSASFGPVLWRTVPCPRRRALLTHEVH